MDRTTFASEYRKAFPKLWTLAVGLCGNREQANDIVQDAVIRSWTKINQFEQGTDFCSWLARFVRNIALNQNRKLDRQKTMATDPLEMDAQIQLSIPDECHSAKDVEESFDERVKSALNRLSSMQRSCLLLRVVNELNVAEIANLLEIPAGTVTSHLSRGKSRLREFLSPLAGGTK